MATVRGCEVEGLLDDKGHLIEDQDDMGKFKSDERTIRVWLDTNQYQADSVLMSMCSCSRYKLSISQVASRQGAPNVYETFNVIMRRDPKENNFKAVLESIRDLMNSQVSVGRFLIWDLTQFTVDGLQVPEWLHDIFLGYGDVGKAHYSKMDNQV